MTKEEEHFMHQKWLLERKKESNKKERMKESNKKQTRQMEERKKE